VYGGYVGKMLRLISVDREDDAIDTFDYVPPTYIGGIGLGNRLLWEETNEEHDRMESGESAHSCLGPLCGTPVPTSGRAEVIGLAPQGYPSLGHGAVSAAISGPR